MACNFFSLGSGNGNCSNRETNPLPENLNNNNNNNFWNSSILYRNEEIYQKGLIWQQYVQFHHHNDTLLGPTSRGGMNCQDCGNQAKKDCSHLRCRACCNGRGLDCATHVRSTWVPAAKRRERQQQRQQLLHRGGGGESSDDHQTTQQKRQRENNINYLGGCTTTTITSAPRLARASTSKGLELGQHFPAEITSPAVFRCVRVHSIDNADEQLAYQTAVNIGGHFFKGILYDQGPENRYTPIPPGGGGGAETANLMNDNATTTITTKQPEAALLDPNTMYSPPISAFLACTQFFQTPRS